jgi:predicted dinucleotide-binding enzyme
MARRIAVAGYGAVGRGLAERLSVRRDEVRIVQRQAPQALPVNAAFVRANLEDAGEAQASVADVDTVVCAVHSLCIENLCPRVAHRNAQLV